ncbi:hypothetical protein [Campylobacter ureolyticus]|uniref:Uncharacterized protein n=1 Tax=Campylobacter ureolyticus TaxID=827 RepID=A0A9Q4KI75_9BACT|nr:hypothetical protein [Campylobacter ureolyticus]MCZ6160651.1 hypothetical protein [Campylobacter ureolyticus]MCZ6164385.1 hypothetical protein [Campylobacter ureolyticus]MCZ6166228.1 hypothetical protein [Campylobacter ureolyticus]MCZ6167987.1 hypothetical protein [Campylobacter ureolyticus]MCZ6175065.1 hypothetical protein [Campylobacter ureolyticus]
MSDDKREKLREYLRNNRPKNRANLGNSSDDKENSNKNLEDDLNLDNSNLDNSQISNNKTNLNKRDYDKKPLIIQSYEEFFVLTLFIISLVSCPILVAILEDLRNYGNVLHKEFVWFSLIPISYIIIIVFFQKFKFKNHKIKFTNNYIEFYDYGKLKRRCKIIENQLVRPFFSHCRTKKYIIDKALDLIILLSVISLFLSDNISGVLVLISFYFPNLTLKFIFYIFLNKSFKGFKAFPFIQVTESCPTTSMYGALLSARYYLIYLYNYEIYKELKQYFLQKNIDIDNLPKSYNIF